MASEAIPAHADESHPSESHAVEYERADFAHPSPVRTLLMTFFALVTLTLLTVAVSAVFDLGRWEIWVSLGIATVKAALVMLFFMHMIHEKPFNALFFMSSFFFVALFIGFTLMDTNQYQNEIRSLNEEDVPQHKVGEPKFFNFTGDSPGGAE